MKVFIHNTLLTIVLATVLAYLVWYLIKTCKCSSTEEFYSDKELIIAAGDGGVDLPKLESNKAVPPRAFSDRERFNLSSDGFRPQIEHNQELFYVSATELKGPEPVPDVNPLAPEDWANYIDFMDQETKFQRFQLAKQGKYGIGEHYQPQLARDSDPYQTVTNDGLSGREITPYTLGSENVGALKNSVDGVSTGMVGINGIGCGGEDRADYVSPVKTSSMYNDNDGVPSLSINSDDEWDSQHPKNRSYNKSYSGNLALPEIPTAEYGTNDSYVSHTDTNTRRQVVLTDYVGNGLSNGAGGVGYHDQQIENFKNTDDVTVGSTFSGTYNSGRTLIDELTPTFNSRKDRNRVVSDPMLNVGVTNREMGHISVHEESHIVGIDDSKEPVRAFYNEQHDDYNPGLEATYSVMHGIAAGQ